MRQVKILIALPALLAALAAAAGAQATQMVAVSADIVEISGSIQKTRGFSWNQFFDFSEATIPGILTLGDFERKTQLAASLKLLETEGKAQILSNPKIVTKSGTQANITVGGEIPVPYSNAQGVGAESSRCCPWCLPRKRTRWTCSCSSKCPTPTIRRPWSRRAPPSLP